MFIEAKDDGSGGDNWTTGTIRSCKAPVKPSPPTNQHPVFLKAGCPSCRPTNSVKALKRRQFRPGQGKAMGQNQLQLSTTLETIRVNELFTKVHRNAPFPAEKYSNIFCRGEAKPDTSCSCQNTLVTTIMHSRDDTLHVRSAPGSSLLGTTDTILADRY